MTDHAQRIRDDLKYVFEIRKVCLNDKRLRINKFLEEIINIIKKEQEKN